MNSQKHSHAHVAVVKDSEGGVSRSSLLITQIFIVSMSMSRSGSSRVHMAYSETTQLHSVLTL